MNCPRCHNPLFTIGGKLGCMLMSIKGHQQVTLCETIADMRKQSGQVPITAHVEVWKDVFDVLERAESGIMPNAVGDASLMIDGLRGMFEEVHEETEDA